MPVREHGAGSMGGAIGITRVDLTAAELRAAAGREKNGAASRRLCVRAIRRPTKRPRKRAATVTARLPKHAKGKPIEIWFQDEARIGQHGTLTRIWARRTRPRAPRDQRYEWAYIFGAVCPQHRTTAALVLPAADTNAISMHLAEISRRVAPGAHAALVIDGAGYHGAARLVVPSNITLIRLPPYAPELNPVENIWEYLRGNKLAIAVFESYDDIVDKSCAAWRFFADDLERVASITSRTWATVIP